MTHREKCEQLKALRKEMADRAGVDLHQTVCTFEGECSGTCPKCAKEESILNKILLSGKIALAGMAIGATALTGCGTNDLAEADNPGDEFLKRRENREEKIENNCNNSGIDPDDGRLDGDVEYDPGYDYAGGEQYIDVLEGEALPGDIDETFLLSKAMLYADAAYAEVDHYDGNDVIICCYDNPAGDTEPVLLDIITVDRFDGDATDMAGNSFSIYDVE